MPLPKSRLEVWTPGKGRTQVRDLTHADALPSRPDGCQFHNLWEAGGCNRCSKNRTCNPPPSDSDADWDRRHAGQDWSAT